MENSPTSRINGSGSDGGLTDAGIAALKQGDKARARTLLAQALKRDPNNLHAWLWLSGAVETEADRRRCLQRVLQIDPHNRAAQRGLEQLRAVAAAPSEAKAGPTPEAAPQRAATRAETIDLASHEQQVQQAAPKAQPTEAQRVTQPLEAGSVPTNMAPVEAAQAPQVPSASASQIVWPPPETPATSGPAGSIVWPPPETPATSEQEQPNDLAELRPKRDAKALLHQAQERLLQLKQFQFKKPELKKPQFLQKLPSIKVNKKLKRLLHPIYLAYAAFGVVVMIAFGVAISQFVSQMMAQQSQAEQIAFAEPVEVTPTLDHFTLARTATADARRATAEARATERVMAPTPTIPAQRGLASASAGIVSNPEDNKLQDVSTASADPIENVSPLVQQGRELAEAGRNTEAIGYYSRALGENPDDAGAYYYWALLMNEAKDYRSAVDMLTRAIEKEPNFPQAYYERCRAHNQLNDFNSSLLDCQRAIDLKPDYVEAHLGIVSAYIQLSRYEEALDVIDRALELDPENGYAFYSRGYIRSQFGHNQAAIEDYTLAMQLDESINAYCLRGTARFYVGDYEGAVADCSEAIRLNPEELAPYYNRARSYAAMGDYERALQDYTQIIALSDRPANAYLQRGMIYEYLGRSDQALQDYNKADQLYKASGNSYGSSVVQQLIQRLQHQPEV